jgi:hypothetical protein
MSAVSQQRTASAKATAPEADNAQSKKHLIIDFPWRRTGIYVLVALGFFLIGAIPMWNRARDYAAERETAQRELRLARMENFLAAAVIDADRGEYEPARQTASDFFTTLRNQVDRGVDSDLSANQREKMKMVMSQRDEIITLLARSDPAVAGRLSSLYVMYRSAVNGAVPVASTKAATNFEIRFASP